MITGPENALLDRLAAEGVAPWLTTDDRGNPSPEWAGSLSGEHSWFGFLLPDHTEPLPVAREACDAMRSVYDSSGGRDGYVSVPVDQRLTHDPDALVEAARTVHAEVCRPNLLVRIPATDAGIHAYRDCLAEGVGVHGTAILSLERYRRVLDAHIAGAERAMESGIRLLEITGITSFPVGLFDKEINRRLGALPGHTAAAHRNRAGTALARLAYRTRETHLEGWWWRVLRAAGARPPRLLWTGVRPWHVPELIGWNTAQALTRSTLESAAGRHPLRGDNMLNTHPQAHRVLENLRGLGVDPAAVIHELENDFSLLPQDPVSPDLPENPAG
ncbi:transaldolase [Actinopolyspora biskrensis]|uniref:Transaldolase n=1 Tax=Actinopolyspora biskrensis TaxID=1470178 RepID=A0A852ZBI5_9ACTN|nr:transaldolase family protein [Actinopolyspora biskrensis]NYH79987.1 transaldolase [Actinopolyspora biskrensis]